MGSVLAILLIRNRPSPPSVTVYGLPLPSVIHQVITDDEVGGKEVVVVGDVHGCLEELQELLTQLHRPLEDVLLIFCGDIVNKGPLSVETLRFIRTLPHARSVRGNHEEHILRHCKRLRLDRQSPLPAKYEWVRALTDEEMAYLSELPYTLSIPSLNAVVVHAGLVPWLPLARQRLPDLVFMRNLVDVDGAAPRGSERIDDGVPWASRWTGPEHVYFGHDARRSLQRYPLCTGLDTGCVYGGHLAAVLLTGDRRLLTVPAKKVYRQPKEALRGL